jgi:hypothetical protein
MTATALPVGGIARGGVRRIRQLQEEAAAEKSDARKFEARQIYRCVGVKRRSQIRRALSGPRTRRHDVVRKSYHTLYRDQAHHGTFVPYRITPR